MSNAEVEVVRWGQVRLWHVGGMRTGQPKFAFPRSAIEFSDGTVEIEGEVFESWREASFGYGGIWLWDGDEEQVFGDPNVEAE